MAFTGSTAKGLYCPKCESRYEINDVAALCQCGAPLLVDYDYQQAAELFAGEDMSARERSIWRYREILQVQDDANIVTMGVGGASLVP